MRILRYLALAALAACGGAGGPTGGDTPPDNTVASVSVTPATLGPLNPGGTAQLTATARNAAGTAVSKSFSWSSSSPSVATVSNSGFVTAVAAGDATVSATADGKSGSVSVHVESAAAPITIGPAGGTVSLPDGSAKITIPPGALATALPITITPVAVAPSPAGVVPGTVYELGPSGTTFATPVTLEFKYAAGDSATDLYHIHRFTNGKWVDLGGSVNRATRTVIAQTSSFSEYGVRARPIASRITIVEDHPVVLLGNTLQLTVTARDQYGEPAPLPKLTWIGDIRASVSSTGLVTPIAPGTGVTISLVGRDAVACDQRPCAASGWGVVGDSMIFSSQTAVDITVQLRPIASIEVSPSTSTLSVGQTRTLAATLKEANGTAIDPIYRTVTWGTSNAAVATVAADGTVTAIGAGTATITASLEGKSGSATVTVGGSTSTNVASVDVGPFAMRVEVGGTLPITATPRDANGLAIAGKTVTWSTTSPSLISIAQNGVVTGLAPGAAATILANVDGVFGGVQVKVIAAPPLVVGTPATKTFTSCLLRSSGTVWCWGRGTEGQLGNGTNVDAQIVPGVVSGLAGVTKLSVGYNFSCAIAGGAAYCWGVNNFGQIGDGSTSPRNVPSAVAGGHAFVSIAAGLAHACALEAGGTAWCWGSGGKTGDGTNIQRNTPVQVAGGIAFAELAATSVNTCGRTAGGAVWCWGTATHGEAGLGGALADGGFAPQQIAGSFTKLVAGNNHLCGLTSGGAIMCWGANPQGQLGDGTQTSRSGPTPVMSGGRTWIDVATGENTCALASDHTAWCWGDRGSLGDGAPTGGPVAATTPIAVYGGKTFSEIAVGGAHACARATDGTWCWGSTGNNGQLGTGDPIDGVVRFLTPVKVVFPM